MLTHNMWVGYLNYGLITMKRWGVSVHMSVRPNDACVAWEHSGGSDVMINDVIFYDQLTVHCTSDNNTDKPDAALVHAPRYRPLLALLTRLKQVRVNRPG